MDIKMPIMNGYDAAKEIKKIRPQLPIIAQSAYALDSEISKYGNAFESYITKPIKKDVLQNILSEFVERF